MTEVQAVHSSIQVCERNQTTKMQLCAEFVNVWNKDSGFSRR